MFKEHNNYNNKFKEGKIMKKILVFTLMFMLLVTPFTYANFTDGPTGEHWVYEDFQILKDAGILKGYPDETFRGDQSATRYEMAAVTARAFSILELKLSDKVDYETLNKNYLDKDELEKVIADSSNGEKNVDEVYNALNELEKEFANELENSNTRLTTIENNVEELDVEVTELKKKNTELNKRIKELENKHGTTRILSYLGIIAGVVGIFMPM